MSGIIGVTVGTPTSPAKMKEEINPVLMVNGKKPDATGNVTVSGGGGGGDTTDLENRMQTLEEQMAELLYTPIAITSFSHSAGTRELGETVDAVTLYWDTNKTPTTLELDGAVINSNLTSKQLTGLSISSSNIFFELNAYDEEGASDSKTTSINFFNGVYYGAAAAPSAYNSTFIRSLTKELRSNKKPSFSVTAGSGQYIYYCLPTRMGTCSFMVNVSTGGFALVDTIAFTNALGYTENYYIYKSDNANLGSTTVSVD